VDLAAEEAAKTRTPSAEEQARTVITLAETYFSLGHKDKAKKFAQKAVEAAAGQSAELREEIEERARRLGTN
jgi:hypothetical protein